MDQVGKISKEQLMGDEMLFPRLSGMTIEHLKGLSKCDLHFARSLIAIMGVNGVGKSTVIQALACSFRPDLRDGRSEHQGERIRFTAFFRPNTDATWKGSEFTLHYDFVNSKGEIRKSGITREYYKRTDRWAPRYSNQPIKDTKYIGISSCIPEIEKDRYYGAINYEKHSLTDKTSEHVLKDAAYILNKDYEALTVNKTSWKEYIGVSTSKVAYSSLSMGAGEQRLIKILQTLYSINTFSLILIDEIDLLLHSDALIRFIKIAYQIAEKRHLQIIFTTHSLVMNRVKDIVQIIYLQQGDDQTYVYDGLTTTGWSEISGQTIRPIHIFVEDELSKTIINSIAYSLNMKKKVQVDCFGAAENAFVLATGLAIEKSNTENLLIVLDGDVYISNDEKKNQLKKKYTGTEEKHDNNINAALSLITQYNLPADNSPEEFLHSLLKDSNNDNEIITTAKGIQAVRDRHDWIDDIADKIDDRSETVMEKIIEECSKNENWANYVKPIYDWLEQRKDI